MTLIPQYVTEVKDGSVPDHDHTRGPDRADQERFATMGGQRKPL